MLYLPLKLKDKVLNKFNIYKVKTENHLMEEFKSQYLIVEVSTFQ